MKTWIDKLMKRAAKLSGELAPAPVPSAPAPVTAAVSPDIESLIASGNELEDAGKPDEALQCYREAISRDPSSARAHLNAGNALRALGEAASALDMYERAVQLDPGSAGAQLNRGTILLATGRFGEAEQAYQSALQRRPDWAEAWVGLACAREEAQSNEQAIAAYTRALAIDPGHTGAASNLSALQLRLLDVTGARMTLEQYLSQMPSDRTLLRRLAALEIDAGRIREGLALQRRLIEQQPDDFGAWNDFIFNSCYSAELTAEQSLADNRRFGELLEATVKPRRLTLPQAGDADRRLRVGYVSADFNIHPISNFIHPILRCHHRDAVEVFCYHTGDRRDRLTEELKQLADHWCDAASLDDEALADRIQQDSIDVLVDLSGHSAGNRLGVFARRPAPLQYTWLGYLGTTGLTRMDYRLCDAHTDPRGVAEHWQTEQPARLPDSQWCYEQRIVTVPPVSPLPRLNNGYWTFGSFNNYRKLNEPVLAAWAEVLKALPDSRLRLYSFENRESGERVVNLLSGHGIARDRLSWHLRTGPEDHFLTFADVDVALDSFPYNGATTTLDALLMGVPVLVVAGTRAVARGGVSLVSTMGMSDWIADSDTRLAAVALRQLQSVEAMVKLRSELPQRLRSSPLMDADRFVGHLEAVYRAAWRCRCQPDSPA